MASQQGAEVKPALLFMPDISGFTKFVNETEILHSQHIVQELLEILIDSNQLGMKMNEIEGDAILFFKPGNKPSIEELIQQVEKMYFKFHQHLKLYDHQRICPCGACKSAINLKLKVIAHYGEVAEYVLKDHKKLFGKDVIVIHRLLKNDVDHEEYFLLTSPLVQHLSNPPSWVELKEMKTIYDAGEISFSYSTLGPLSDKVPAPELPHYELSLKCQVSFAEEAIINAEMDKVFAAVFDLGRRSAWADGVKGTQVLGHDKINRVGTEHVCILKAKNNPVIVTESADLGDDRIVYIEMDRKGLGGSRNIFEKQPGKKTRVRVEVLVNKNPFIRLFFNLAMKKKYRASYIQSFKNLEKYCREPELTTSAKPVPAETGI